MTEIEMNRLIEHQLDQAADSLVRARMIRKRNQPQPKDETLDYLIRANERLIDLVTNLQTEIERLQFTLKGIDSRLDRAEGA